MELTRFIALLASEFDDLDPNIIGSDSVYKEVIEWNSINSVVLSVIIEAEFGVLLEKEDYQKAVTVAELLELIQTKSD
ncbi:MAG: hypothetical protein K9G41_00925 [Flavobacteriales bacterium]|nr:hypothetical protein [Flavobacteriales bacterium]